LACRRQIVEIVDINNNIQQQQQQTAEPKPAEHDKANIDEGQTQQQQKRLTTDSIGHVQQRLHG
jgi:hypothetical protein